MSQNGDPTAYSDGNSLAYASPGQLIAAGAVLPALGIIIVALRFYTRLLQKARLGIDDYLILPAVLLVVGMGAALIAGVEQEAVGYPTPPPPNADTDSVFAWRDPKITIVQKVQFITQLLMTAAYGFIKLSIIYFYRRVFIASKNDRLNIITNVCTVIIVAWTIAYILAIAFDCGTTFHAHWGSISDLFTYCHGGFPVQKIYKSLLISDLITDVIILALPLPRIWALHLTPARKIAVTGILLLGGVATGAAAARLAIFVSQIRRSLDPTVDENKSVSTVLYWSMIEAGLSLIAACLPTIQHLFRGRSIGSVVASVRSAISLTSLAIMSRVSGSSGGSRGSRNRSNTQVYGEDHTLGSTKRLAQSGNVETRTSGASEDPAPRAVENMYKSGTGVNKTVTIEMTSQRGSEGGINQKEAWKVV